MIVLRKNPFAKAAKKLHANQAADLNKAVNAIMENPAIGKSKGYDLTAVRVYKFRMVNQEILLSYSYDEYSDTLTLYRFASHQNFYRDEKRG